MKDILIKYAIVAFSVVLFYNVFWHASAFDINLISFGLFSMASMIFINKEVLKRPIIQHLSIIVFLSAIAVVLSGSGFSKTIFFFSFFFFVAAYNFQKLKTIVFLPLAFLIGAAVSPFRAIYTIYVDYKSVKTTKKGYKKSSKFLIYTIPVLVLFLFMILFSYANPKFAELVHSIFIPIKKFFRAFIELFEVGKIALIIFGLFWAFMFYLSSSMSDIIGLTDNWTIDIIRDRSKKIFKTQKIVALKNEYKATLFLAITMNVMLLCLNFLDISWVWFGFTPVEQELSNFVHEGTYMLIISVLITFGIIMYIFRRNQNFYPKANVLKKVSYFWLAQVAILLVSVIIKNCHYISYYGLTSKRIGVFVFLLVIIVTLFVVLYKLWKNKSAFYVISQSAKLGLLTLVIVSFINWDCVVVRYNLETEYQAEIDYNYLLSFSNKTSYILLEHKDMFEDNSHERIDYKVKSFEKWYDRKQGFSFSLTSYMAHNKNQKNSQIESILSKDEDFEY